MKYKLLVIICLLSFLNSEAQIKNVKNSGYKIEISIPKSAGNILHLAAFSDGVPYSIDSVMVSSKGKAVFKSDKQLPQGQYLLYKKPDVQMEILVGNEQSNIRIALDENNLQNSKVEGSKDTKLFWEYIRYINQNNEELSKLNQKLDKTDNLQEKEELWDELVSKEKHLLQYMHSQVQQHQGTWFASFLKGSISIALPISKPASMEDVNTNNAYNRKHYFDNIDFDDSRLWNTNYFPRMINEYLSQLIPQIPDTVANETSMLVAKTVNDSTAFEKMLSYTLNNAMQSKYMGMENVWAKLAEDYILNKNLSWIEKEKEAQIRSLYEVLKFNRIGMEATNIQAISVDGDTINTNDTSSDFTVLFFYNTTCSHCKQTINILRSQIFPKYKANQLSVIAFNIDSNEQAWKSYVKDNKLSEWINCFDPAYKSAYWMYYDTSSVPMIYVLDKNKRIIARKIDGENLEKLLGYYIK